jgi:uncharacterized lipoprotein YddW (UPF0748 family)
LFQLEQSDGFTVNPPVIRLALLCLMAVVCARAATTYVLSNSSPPPIAREFRGAWVASVNNIDWPSQPGLPTQQQKDELLAILNKCGALKLNVVVFQVRPACDALYASKLEPWSVYLTGEQGRAPNPFWDPLEFAVAQAHARGLELHAWFNPFRARHSTGSRYGLAANHISKMRPELAKTYGTHLWLDPGLQEVHDYSARVILDVVQRYDIDGVHIDDYFYPYREKDAGGKEIPFPDWTSWGHYQKSGGKLSRDDWRRDNVNRFIARMYRDVHAAKPWVKVGVSPFGIYRPGFPAQIKGFDQYQSIYADPRTWLVNGWVDYLAPQLYWRIEPPAQSFPVLLKWWTENNPKHRMIVPGLNTTAIGALNNYSVSDAGNKGWPASEIVRQIEITRQQAGVAGHLHWNMGALMKNKGGVDDALLRSCYQQPALAPALNGGTKPPTPRATVRVTGMRADLDVAPLVGADIRYWLIQVRRADGTWDVDIDPARSLTWSRSPAPSAFAVRAVDKFGNLGAATVLQRTEVQPRTETPPRSPIPLRRGK